MSTENTETIKTTLDSETAKRLIIDYVEANPDVFDSPGRTESAEAIRKETISKKSTGKLSIGRFSVDLDNKTYRLVHLYGHPGEGWFENWEWEGSFQVNLEGQWTLGEPEFVKSWGQ